jgi:phospholipid-transporting ATPase
MQNDGDNESRAYQVSFGSDKDEKNYDLKASNKTRTSKYTLLSWAPLSLLYQFTRVANIYFLIISILTAMPFSPKSPGSMIGTFAGVLIFTMLKELFEDYFRMRSDREVNNTSTHLLNHSDRKFEKNRWKDVQLGDIVRVNKNESFPCDMLCIYAREDSIWIDTMNLDGETALKPKTVGSTEMWEYIKQDLESVMIDDQKNLKTGPEEGSTKQIDKYSDRLYSLSGTIDCEGPSENLESWDGIINFKMNQSPGKKYFASIDSMLLRGCYLRNTDY